MFLSLAVQAGDDQAMCRYLH